MCLLALPGLHLSKLGVGLPCQLMEGATEGEGMFACYPCLRAAKVAPRSQEALLR